MGSSRVPALLLALALVATACGSRLSEDEIAIFAGQGQQGAGAPAPAPAQDGGTVAPPQTDDQSTAAPDAGATAAPGDTGGQAGGSTGGNDAQAPGGGGGGQQADQGAGAQSTDTRAAPPGGNGGATDVGVTETEIVVYQVADLTGAVPGLFQDTKEATQAYFTYFAQTEGTVYGRQIRFVSRDTGLSSNGNRSAYLDACEQAFAAVGSMSAFEEGAVDPIRNCNPTFPDLRNIRTSEALQKVPNSLGTDALRVGEIPLSEWEFYKERMPQAIKAAGYVFLENTTTQFQTGQNRSATAKIGYEWDAVIPVALAETNYARIVNELKSKEIRFVAFQGAYQQAARLVDAMRQQGYAPDAFALQSNIYTPQFLELCSGKCDDFVFVAQTGALVEEVNSNKELQTYAEWVARINPNAQPTGLGMYSWGAAKLFVEALKEIGPELTREKLISYLEDVHDYDGGGLFPTQDVGTQQPRDCIIMLDIQDNQFVRAEKGNDYRCRPKPGPV